MRKIKIGNEEYEIYYGQNSVCALEDELNEPITEIFSRFENQKFRLKDVRALIWAGLLKQHRNLTPEAVGDICDKAGVNFASILPEFTEELSESFKKLIPEEPDPKEEAVNKKK